jgi:hypothetical protein
MSATSSKLFFENFYNKHCEMVYGLAQEISESDGQANEIFTETFLKAHAQNIANTNKDHPAICVVLIKILIQTAHEKINNNQGETNFELKNFKNFTILHELFCEQNSLKNISKKNNISPEEIGKKIRAELLSIRLLQDILRFATNE